MSSRFPKRIVAIVADMDKERSGTKRETGTGPATEKGTASGTRATKSTAENRQTAQKTQTAERQQRTRKLSRADNSLRAEIEAQRPKPRMPHEMVQAARSRFSYENSSYGLSSHWSVPWSDLMMVMFVMFAVLFSMQLTERDVRDMFDEAKATPDVAPERKIEPFEQPQPISPEPQEQAPQLSVDELLRQSQQLVTEANLEDIDVVLTENQAIKVVVRGKLLFDLGRAELKADAIHFLDRFAQVIASNNYEIQVVGHTDNFPISTPTYPTNWELSAARASSVARYLIRKGKLNPARFTVIGHSLYRPVVPNEGLVNKARNRRVEIIITRNEYLP